MKTSMTLPQLATELDRMKGAKRDFVAPAKKITLVDVGGRTRLNLEGSGDFGITRNAHRQIANRMDVPQKYYDRMLADAPDLLRTNINRWLGESDHSRLVRTLDGDCRAFLSDRYRRMDNVDLLGTAIPILMDVAPDMVVSSCDVNASRMHLKVNFPQVEGEVKAGEVVRAGLSLRNDEVGGGRLVIARFIEILWCTNGMTMTKDFGRNHVGRRVTGEDDSFELFSDETLKVEDEALWRKVGDIIRASASNLRFEDLLAEMKAATEGTRLESPEKAIVEVADLFDLNDTERGSVLKHLIEGGDLSRWGTLNAVTRAAEDMKSYDRATDLEDIGGKILELSTKEWDRIALTN